MFGGLLGKDARAHVTLGSVWCSRSVELNDNHRLIDERPAELPPGVRNRLRDGFPATGREGAIHVNATILALYGNFAGFLGRIIAENGVKVPSWGQLEKGYRRIRASLPPTRSLAACRSTTGSGTSS